MLSIKQAIKKIKEEMPNGRIISAILYNGLYVFKVFSDDELEGEMDPFYSVNIKTGEFRDFSIITDGKITEIIRMFNENDLMKK